MLVEDRNDHGAHRDDALARGSCVLQGFLHEDGRQAPSAERRIDFGVVEDALIAAVDVSGVQV